MTKTCAEKLESLLNFRALWYCSDVKSIIIDSPPGGSQPPTQRDGLIMVAHVVVDPGLADVPFATQFSSMLGRA